VRSGLKYAFDFDYTGKYLAKILFLQLTDLRKHFEYASGHWYRVKYGHHTLEIKIKSLTVRLQLQLSNAAQLD